MLFFTICYMCKEEKIILYLSIVKDGNNYVNEQCILLGSKIKNTFCKWVLKIVGKLKNVNENSFSCCFCVIVCRLQGC